MVGGDASDGDGNVSADAGKVVRIMVRDEEAVVEATRKEILMIIAAAI